MDFNNKNIIVTGGTRGIGYAITALFEKTGANIIVTGTKETATGLINESKNIIYHQLDYNSDKSVRKFIDYVNQLDVIDILVNNAGTNKIDLLTDIATEDWDEINRVNLRGPFLLAQAVSKKLKIQKSGKIINIASIFGVVSKVERAAYSSTKWGLIGFTKAIALELAQYNVQVNSVSPGFIDTDLTHQILGKEKIKQLMNDIPQGRLAKPDEIGKVVLFLASDENTYITGQNIIVDGGFTSA